MTRKFLHDNLFSLRLSYGMCRCRRFAPLLALLLLLSSSYGAKEPQPLSGEELANALRIEALTIPTPGELLAAITRYGKPNWQSLYRKPIPTAYTSRAQIAFNLGGLLADGYIAIQAEDSQQVKNLGRDIMALAKTLGVSENVLRRGNSITDFAENNQWSALKEELEATQNEVRIAMEEMRDHELITLLVIGAWVRGTEAVTAWVSANYTPELARLLRQPAIVAFLREKLQALPQKLQEDILVNSVHNQLAELEQLVSFSREATPTLDEVNRLKNASQKLVQEIAEKK